MLGVEGKISRGCRRLRVGFNNRGIGSGAVTPLNRYADKNGTFISTPTLTNTSTTGDTFGNANVYTTNDPGVGFAGTPNFATGVPTSSGGRVSAGTLNISGFSSGTIYLLAGAFDNDLPVNLSMTGTGQTTLTADNGALNTEANRNMYVFAYDFDNAGGLYNEISYSILNTGSNSGNRARFMGAIVNATAIPEPSAALLGGLGMLVLLRRRRA